MYDQSEKWLENGQVADALRLYQDYADFQHHGNCDWEFNAEAAKDFKPNIVNFGLGEDNLDEATPGEHEYWLNNTFLVNDLEARCFYAGTLEDCADYGISQADFHESLPISPRITTPLETDYEAMKPFFCGLPTDVIKATFKNTSQNM